MFMNTTSPYPDDCIPLLFNISSDGLWENLKSPDVIFGYSLPLVELQLLLIFLSIVVPHMLLRYIGISKTASYMIAGLILGPQLFDLRGKSSGKLSLDPMLDGNAVLNAVSACGSIFFIFLMTIRINRRVVFSSGPLPVVIGTLVFFCPFVVCLCFQKLFNIRIDSQYMPLDKAMYERLAITGTQSSIVLTTIAHMLSELKILNSEFGRLALSSTIINEIIGMTFLVLSYSFVSYKNSSRTKAFTDLLAIVVLVFITFFVVKTFAKWIVKQTPEGKPVASVYVHSLMLIVLASSVYTTTFSFKHMIGPFFLGFVIPVGPPLGSALEATYEKLIMNVFLPISVAFPMMRCDVMRIINELDDIKYNIYVMAMTMVLKLVTAIVPCLYCKLPLKESIAISILLSCKSFSDIFVYEVILDESYISQATYTFLILQALLNGAIVPVALKSLYDPKRKYIGYQNRNILSLKPDSELRILTFVHRPYHISGAIGFLQLLSSPNREHPLVVTVLHLVKLVGQIVPNLISHAKQSKQLTKNSYINTVLLAFNQFSQENLDSTTVKMFTALSHENLVHDDICTLALDQSMSMIVVPSGRSWTIDGAFESDDEAIRYLNMSLLECAPCSIGILVDRGQFLRRGKINYDIQVGVIFIGGKDDREALSLVKRMKHNPKVHVTVIRLMSNQEIDYTNYEYVLDQKTLKELNDSQTTNDFEYIERIVADGPEVATTLRLLAEEYDLMVVGRSHGIASPDFTGLKEWMELPELGVIGDLLAVRDLNCKLSVLVVQQQHHA